MIKTAIFGFMCFFCGISLAGFSQVIPDDFKQQKSDHFILNYDPQVSDSLTNTIKNYCEQDYRQITEQFNLNREDIWSWENRAQIFIAKDQQQYKDLFSCPQWSAACVDYVNKKVFLFKDQETIEEILAHELTHVIAREYVGQNNLPLWLDEGMAMYIPKVLAQQDTDNELIRQLIANNSYIDFTQIAQVNSQILENKDPAYVQIFYQQAFSIVNFLVKYYGREKFRLFLFYLRDQGDADQAFRQAFPECGDMAKLQQHWQSFYTDE